VRNGPTRVCLTHDVIAGLYQNGRQAVALWTILTQLDMRRPWVSNSTLTGQKEYLRLHRVRWLCPDGIQMADLGYAMCIYVMDTVMQGTFANIEKDALCLGVVSELK